MKSYLEYQDDNSHKFWEITLAGLKVTTRYGKIKTDGQVSEKTFESAQKAEKEYNKLIAEKTKKGYLESQFFKKEVQDFEPLNLPKKPDNAEWCADSNYWRIGKKNEKGQNIGEWLYWLAPTDHFYGQMLYENGIVTSEITYHIDGTYYEKATYKNGLRHGTWYWQASENETTADCILNNVPEGTFQKEIEYNNDKFVSEKYFTKVGKEIFRDKKTLSQNNKLASAKIFTTVKKEYNKLIAEQNNDNKLITDLEDYRNWITMQEWFKENNKDSYITIQHEPNATELEILVDKFGKLPQSYLKTLVDFGLSEFTYDCYKTKMLSPKQIIEFYDVVQNEMDFTDGLREEIKIEDGIDFSKYIPVMAGEGQDGCWALLNLDKKNNGQILYWDTDQSGDLESTFKNLEEFILSSFSRAKDNNPLRLT